MRTRRAVHGLTGYVAGYFCLALSLLPACVLAVPTPEKQQAMIEQVNYQQHIGAKLPSGLRFQDAEGNHLAFDSLIRDKPLILAMAWYNCPQLCPMLLDRIAAATENLPFDRDAYRVAVVSIAPDEGPADAQRIKHELHRRHGELTDGWHLLTGRKPAIDALANSLGFEYAYDEASGQYAHPAGLAIIAPGGTISQYLLGIRPATPDLRLALTKAGQGEIGSPVDRILLRCYRYDPETGEYTLAVMNLLRVAGGGTALALVGAVIWMRRREHS
ncbi:protein SCO1/2 [Modicisalibacter muralis]|uniref:Protein SCO1/2 n=1 Tax=Modicisalibacter muralis TaxID=119000 RepID=A0A1G9MD09_9GAMM|nr:SCO family protein [Halomonas muralis]SDL72146.1 protein SCO1/2 [Halomonas muralis]